MSLVLVGGTTLRAQTAAFTYQGRLLDQFEPADGLYDFRFHLFDAPTNGLSLAGSTNLSTAVQNGLFTVVLDFGPVAFDGGERWLEIVTSPGGGNNFTTLSPRQPITATPHALWAYRAAIASEAATAQSAARVVDGAITDAMLAANLSNDLARLSGLQVFEGPLGLMTNDPQAELHVAGGKSFFDMRYLSEVNDDVDGFNYLDGPNHFALSGDHLFVVAAFDDALSILDISDPRQPRLTAEVVQGRDPFLNFATPTQVAVSGDRAYVTCAGSGALTILDISDRSRPRLLGEVLDDSRNPGSLFTHLDAPLAVAVAGSIAIVADNSDAVSFIDVTDPVAPQLLAVIVDDDVDTNSVFRFLHRPTFVATQGSLAFIVSGRNRSDAGSLTIVNFANPTQPELVAQIADDVMDPASLFTRLRGAGYAVIDGDTLYISAQADGAITVLDIADPGNPTLVTEMVSFLDGQRAISNPGDLHLDGTTLYIPNSFSLYAVDVTDRADPQFLQSVSGNINGFPGIQPDAVLVRDGIGYLRESSASIDRLTIFSKGGQAGLVVDARVGIGTAVPRTELDVAGGLHAESADVDGAVSAGTLNLAGPSILDSAGDATLQVRGGGLLSRVEATFLAEVVHGQPGITNLSTPQSFAASGFNVFVPSRFDHALNFFTFLNATNPVLRATVEDDSVDPNSPFTRLSNPSSAAVSGSSVLVTAENGVTVMRTFGSALIKEAEVFDGDGEFNRLSDPRFVTVRGQLAFVAAESSLTIIDVSDPANPQLLSEVSDDSLDGASPFQNLDDAFYVHVQNNLVFVISATEQAMNIIDVSDPTDPTLLSVVQNVDLDPDSPFTKLRIPLRVAVQDDIAYVIRSSLSILDHGLTIIDVSNPAMPRLIAEIDDNGTDADSPFTDLDFPQDVKIFKRGELTFAVVSAISGFTFLDVTDPYHPQLAGVLPDGFRNFQHLRGAGPMVLSGNRLFVATVVEKAITALEFNVPRVGLTVEDWVGIGTSAPTAALDVAGTVRADQIGIGTSDPRAALDVMGAIFSRGESGGAVSVFNPNNQLASASLSWKDNTARIRVGGSGGVASGAQNGLDIETTGDISLMRIRGDGKVGIGTVDPTGEIGNTGLRVANSGHVVVDNNFGFFSVNANPANGIGAGMDTTITDDLQLYAGSGPRVHVGADGKIGIGTLTPQAELDVAGTVRAGAFVGDGSGLTNLPTSPTSDGHSLDAADGAPTDVVFVDNAGRVGIGTTSPQQPLHVRDGSAGLTPNANSTLAVERDTSTFINILTPDGVQSGVLFGKPTGGTAAGGIVFNSSGTEDGLQFRVNGNSTKMVLQNDGDVGIGTTAPQGDLHVRGDSALGSLIVTPGTSDSSAQLLLTENTSASLGGILRYDGTANQIQLLGLESVGETVPHMSINRSNGRVGIGIGTTSPAETLRVGGDVRIDGSVTIPATTRYLALPASSFVPENRVDFNSTGGGPTLSFALVGSGDGRAFASVNLPHGAVVTEFAASVGDLSSSVNITVRLQRTTFADSVAPLTMASVTSTGTGAQVLVDPSISSAMIDNATYLYWVMVTFPDGSPASLSHRLSGARITYEVTAPLP